MYVCICIQTQRVHIFEQDIYFLNSKLQKDVHTNLNVVWTQKYAVCLAGKTTEQ